MPVGHIDSCSADGPGHPDTEVAARDGAAGSATAPGGAGVKEKGLCHLEVLFRCLFLAPAMPERSLEHPAASQALARAGLQRLPQSPQPGHISIWKGDLGMIQMLSSLFIK